MEKSEMMKRYEAEEEKKFSHMLKRAVEGDINGTMSTGYVGWLETKANISDDAIEAFQKIIRNQCDEISALKEKAEAYDRLMSGGKKTPKEVSNFLDLPIAQDKEGFWYAFGSPPVIDEFRGTWGSLLGYEKEIPSCNIRYSGDWKDSLTLPDGWEEK